ncbi:MAG: hypothetical protein JSU63_00830 [Phycisphaerales bacterium]|nr:MAG: hypothetical protein JSU63_00830 [Phycisphaerales bacterium]
MEIFLDDQQVDSEFIGEHTVEDALRHVQANVCNAGEVVVGVRCDGRDVGPNEMAATLGKSAATFNKLEVFTSTPQRLVVEAMSQASSALDDTEAACQRIADLLTRGDTADGIAELGDCLGVWQKIHDAVGQAIQMLQLDPDKLKVEQEPLLDVVSRPKEVLLEIKQALESQDHVLLADIMQYEFGDVTEKWHKLVNMLRREAEGLVETDA